MDIIKKAKSKIKSIEKELKELKSMLNDIENVEEESEFSKIVNLIFEKYPEVYDESYFPKILEDNIFYLSNDTLIYGPDIDYEENFTLTNCFGGFCPNKDAYTFKELKNKIKNGDLDEEIRKFQEYNNQDFDQIMDQIRDIVKSRKSLSKHVKKSLNILENFLKDEDVLMIPKWKNLNNDHSSNSVSGRVPFDVAIELNVIEEIRDMGNTIYYKKVQN